MSKKVRKSFFSNALPDAIDSKLKELYLHAGIPLDQLAYTEEFEELYSKITELDDSLTRTWVYRRMLGLRKRGMLPRFTDSSQSGARDSEADPKLA